MKQLLWPFSSLPLIQEGCCQLQGKVSAKVLVNRFVKLAQEKNAVRRTDHSDMTIAVDFDVKHQTKQTNQIMLRLICIFAWLTVLLNNSLNPDLHLLTVCKYNYQKTKVPTSRERVKSSDLRPICLQRNQQMT